MLSKIVKNSAFRMAFRLVHLFLIKCVCVSNFEHIVFGELACWLWIVIYLQRYEAMVKRRNREFKWTRDATTKENRGILPPVCRISVIPFRLAKHFNRVEVVSAPISLLLSSSPFSPSLSLISSLFLHLFTATCHIPDLCSFPPHVP